MSHGNLKSRQPGVIGLISSKWGPVASPHLITALRKCMMSEGRRRRRKMMRDEADKGQGDGKYGKERRRIKDEGRGCKEE